MESVVFKEPVFVTPQNETEQQRREFDITMVNRIRDGFTPSEEPDARVIDGALSPGAQEAISQLWLTNERGARFFARKIIANADFSPAVSQEDLVHEGFYGMLHASLRWAPEKGRSFFSFAADYMKNYMMNYLDNTVSTVRVPIDKWRELRKVQKTGWNLYQKGHRYPSRTAIAGAMGVDVSEIEDLQLNTAMTREMGTLDGGYSKDNRDRHSILNVGEGRWKPVDPALDDEHKVEDDIMAHELTKMLNEVMGDSRLKLTEKEAVVLRYRFITHEPKTKKELAAMLGVNSHRVGQIERTLLTKFRHPILSEKIRDWLSN